MIRLIKMFIIILTLLTFQITSYAKAYFASKVEMIKKADIIAIVDIINVENTETKSEHWTYGQKVTAKVDEILKGKPSKDITIYGKEDFICAQCLFKNGKFLLFLKYDKNLLVGSNWSFSIRPIKDKSVEWYKKDGKSIFELEYVPLDNVVQEIKSKIKE